MAMDYRDDLNELKQSFKPGQLFGTADVQRKMVWGYNRARNTIDMALEKKEAEEVRQSGLYIEYKFV